jgi:peptidoglycan DL-endopeptidase CwlO
MTTIIAVTLAIVTSIFASITAPLIIAHRTERMHREDQLADYQRQDRVAATAAATAREAAEQVRLVAAQAAHAARALQAAQTESIRRTDEVARATAAQAARSDARLDDTNSKLDIIHGLVNSTLTASMQSELDALVTSLAMMREVVDMKRTAGHEPTAESAIAIADTTARIAELQAALADRAAQAAATAAAQAAATAAAQAAAGEAES